MPPGAPFYTQINDIWKWLWWGLESNRIIPERKLAGIRLSLDMLLGIPPKWWEQCQEEGARQSSWVQGTENQIRKGSNGFSTKKWLPKTTAAIPIVPDPFLRLLAGNFPSFGDLRKQFTRTFWANRLTLSSFKDNNANTEQNGIWQNCKLFWKVRKTK